MPRSNSQLGGHGQAQQASPQYDSSNHEWEPERVYKYTRGYTNQVPPIDNHMPFFFEEEQRGP